MITIATSKDVEQCVQKTQYALTQSPVYDKFEFDYQCATESIQSFIDRWNKIIFLKKINDNIIGGIAAGFYPMFCSDQMESVIHFIWIDPKYRSLKLFKQLINHYFNWTKINNVNKVLLGYSFGTEINRFDSLFQSIKHVKKIGSIYQKC